MKTIALVNVTKEERAAIEFLKTETGECTSSKAIKKGIVSYHRLSSDYKRLAAENARMRQALNIVAAKLRAAHDETSEMLQKIDNI